MISFAPLRRAFLRLLLGTFLGLFESIAVAFEGDELGAVDKAVDEGVIQQRSGDAVKVGEGIDKASEEVVHLGVEVEAKEQEAGVAQDHHKAHQWSGSTPDLEFAEVAPVDLGLLAWEGSKTKESFGRWFGTQSGDDGAEVVGGAGVTAIPGGPGVLVKELAPGLRFFCAPVKITERCERRLD